jgi:hypothetical protein
MGKSKDKKTPRKSDAEEAVRDVKNKATVKKHGVENTSTYEHPASFAA